MMLAQILLHSNTLDRLMRKFSIFDSRILWMAKESARLRGPMQDYEEFKGTAMQTDKLAERFKLKSHQSRVNATIQFRTMLERTVVLVDLFFNK